MEDQKIEQPEDEDVEAHKKMRLATDEAQEEGSKEEDDFELHRKRLAD